MIFIRALLRLLLPVCFLLSSASSLSVAQQSTPNVHFPSPEKLTYDVEWRLINAGTATVQLTRNGGSKGWDFTVNVESAGLVSRLYRVVDTYKVTSSDRFCALTAFGDAQEGKKHLVTKMNFDYTRNKLSYEERDAVKNTDTKKELDILPCTYEITGALASLREAPLEPGKYVTVPISDGKQFARARIQAQAKESVTVGGKTYASTRYEAFLFDNVLYKRRGRLLIWISDDADHLPVQMRLLMGFPIGTVTINLVKQER